MDELTSFDSGANSYVIIGNETTHEPLLMVKDEREGFRPVNADFDPSPDLELSYEWHDDNSYEDLQFYEVNCAALLRLGDWFDFLRRNGAYDNSRIIIVSDHGCPGICPFVPGFSDNRDYSGFSALLMVKDFDSTGKLRTDRSFMTNADVPLLSLAGLDVPAVNPFTGKVFRAEKDGGVNVYAKSDDTDAADLKRKTKFNLSDRCSYHVQDDIYVESNWTPLELSK